MKTNTSFIRIGLLAAVVMLSQACSNKTSFQNSSVVPAAEGSVKIRTDKNNNYVIALEVIRLAQPQRLSPPREIYLVWMETKQNGIQNIGQLKTSSGFLSRTLKSSLETVTSFEPTEIIITAEHNANQQYPGNTVVLRTGPL